MLTRLLESSRFLILIPVIGAMLAAAVAFLFGIFDLAHVVYFTIRDPNVSTRYVTVAITEIADFFLLGTVLYIVSIGLYKLFIGPNIRTPVWLHIETLNSLKERLLGVITILVAITFLGLEVDWKGDIDIRALGGIALVMATLIGLMIANQRHEIEKGRSEHLK